MAFLFTSRRDEPPIRAELLSTSRLEARAQELATLHAQTTVRGRGRRLARDVRRNGRALLQIYRALADAIEAEKAVTPAAAWLVDNYHVVDEQVREIQEDLPAGYYRQLPKLSDGPLAGYPRVLGVAWEYIAHTDSHFDPTTLAAFVRVYQSQIPLTIGELWALAISLRIVLVENMRRLGMMIMTGRQDRAAADRLADALIHAEDDRARLEEVLADRTEETVSTAFALQLIQRLRDREPAVAPALEWLDQRLAASGHSGEQAIHTEHQRQEALNVTVRNVVTSMRAISALDWKPFFESVSTVDHLLRSRSRFGDMDFATRDIYRHAIEELARRSGKSELTVVEAALTHADQSPATAMEKRDPGYYLISKGRRLLEKDIGYHAPLSRWPLRLLVYASTPAYIGTLSATAGGLAALAWQHGLREGAAPVELACLVLAMLFPIADLAWAAVNRFLTLLLKPRRLPKWELRDGVTADLRTLVVVPVLLESKSAVEDHLATMEIHFLANSGGDIRFALLADWLDADEEHLPADEELSAALKEGIAGLNARHGAVNGDPRFYAFVRHRRFNPVEGKWMGWERKRGKLWELNRLLRGAGDTSFEPAPYPLGVRYVLTLDADTRMGRGTVAALAGAMAHPLNRPQLDPQKGRVVEGYAIMQPRVTPILPASSAGSWLQRIYSGPAGIDPYAFAVSDVYQDLFREGSYVGKGIYDVDAFTEALAGRIPENTLLSHDLLEGLFARAGLVADIEVFEEYPSHYGVASMRQHRWMRGDWQLLPWVLAGGSGARQTAIPWIGHWKMLDNLRRSLTPVMTLLAFVLAWTLPSVHPLDWTVIILAVLALPSLLPAAWRGMGQQLLQAFLAVVLLAHQSWLAADAIVRTLWRMAVRRRLLEWVTAAQATSLADLSLGGFYQRMASVLFLAAAAAGTVFVLRPEALAIAAPFLVAWTFSPVLAFLISRPIRTPQERPLSPDDRRQLRLIARRTWRFFETTVIAEHNFLPPDNLQEDPHVVIAGRTSPTNVGLCLLSTLAARDFGWIGTTEMLERTTATLAALKRLETFRGHFYNWYDTRDLRALYPRYISAVDSGNLAGHLLTFAQGLEELEDQPVYDRESLSGMHDSLELLETALHDVPGVDATAAFAPLKGLLEKAPDSSNEWPGFWENAVRSAGELRAWVESATENLEARYWAQAVLRTAESLRRDASAEGTPGVPPQHDLLREACQTAEEMFERMEYSFLINPARELFSIGYRLDDGSLDPSCYDLLASEARLASFIAVANGELKSTHWFRLGRSLTDTEVGTVLVSWSGSMFEYLMPELVMQLPSRSLLDETCRRVVRLQIAYGRERGIPWGVSESAYHARDIELTYQYSNFGVPALGLKRGLSQDVVVAPYATALAAMVDPTAAAANFRALSAEGASGKMGFFEALDYTPARLPEGERRAVVRAYMAHHQGMTLVALDNVIFANRMRRRFHTDRRVQATELLLQERTPTHVSTRSPADELRQLPRVEDITPPVPRRFGPPIDPFPRTQLLSNGRYSVLFTSAGSGYSRWQNLAITRWREDATRDADGTYFFIRDPESAKVWSAGYQPSGADADHYQAIFTEDRAELLRRDGDITTTLSLVVSPEDDAEIRRITLLNRGTDVREIEVTSYAEIVLTTPAADAAHPVFANLFVQTEFSADAGALLATRRRRSPEDPLLWAAHVCGIEGQDIGGLQYETDRARFLGRGRGVRTPMTVIDGQPLSNTTGSVLDPIFSLRRRLRLAPGATARLYFTTLVAPSREAAIQTALKYRDPSMFERASTLAWTQAQVERHHLGIAADEAHLFQELASHALYTTSAMRAAETVLARNRLAAPGLWAHGISGDLPVVLVRIQDSAHLHLIRQILHAHEYWRMKGLGIDIVILNERGTSYIQDLQSEIEALVQSSQARARHESHAGHGRVFMLRADRFSPGEKDVLRSAARIVLVGGAGSLADHVLRATRKAAETIDEPDLFAGETGLVPSLQKGVTALPRAIGTLIKGGWVGVERLLRGSPASMPPSVPSLSFFNGIGGFSADGKEYVVLLGEGQWTPAPWINVIANAQFGFQVSESGSGYTWAHNSRENQLTLWSNDPVTDPPSEVMYIQDLETGECWTPTVLPIREETYPYVARHGQGYSRFEHESHDIQLELLQFVPMDDPIKISRLRVTNRSLRRRRLSVTAYAEWVLGPQRSTHAPHVVTEMDPKTGAMWARNPWNAEFANHIAFADLNGKQERWTADRAEFLGRHGTPDHPRAFEEGVELSNRTGAGLDPCAALQTTIELAPGGHTDILFFLGQAVGVEQARALVEKYRRINIDQVFQTMTRHWEDVLEAVQVETPDASFDLMLNRWLLYQTLSCRVWARAAFYQAGGAYGFRDQLQDTMALVVADRALAREHLLRAAARQFVEGDVQHWWHPPSGRGVRTRFSDDMLWLPYAVIHYTEVTGDRSILDEDIPFLEGPPLAPEQEDAYFTPTTSAQHGTLFEHCARALDRSLEVGQHGLPLMGAGDWNDGMNRVGFKGQGESVWVGWFLHSVLWEFAAIAASRAETSRARQWREHVAKLKRALEEQGWDGDWYRRAYFDDGTPLGSSQNLECRIDSIAQSWAVLSGAADPTRARQAMAAVEAYLVRRGDGLILLFTPPFNDFLPDPGYIKGYLPGVRENGGQYTHAAIWTVLAFAALGDGDKAGELFAILNPINHGSTRAGIHRYRVEPYVAAADIYAEPPHVGRGGWTWYTGSAGWMYRAGLEWILGFRLRGKRLYLDPCIPRAWRQYKITFRYHGARYEVNVENPHGVCRGIARAFLNDQPVSDPQTGGIPLEMSGSFKIRVELG